MRKWGENVWIRVVREGSVCVGGGGRVWVVKGMCMGNERSEKVGREIAG